MDKRRARSPEYSSSTARAPDDEASPISRAPQSFRPNLAAITRDPVGRRRIPLRLEDRSIALAPNARVVAGAAMRGYARGVLAQGRPRLIKVGRSRRMRLLTFNVYFGFDGLSALNEPALGLRQFEETDIRARMMGLARFLAEREPDVAGLQEMVRLSFTDTPEPELFVDFLQILDECVAETGGPRYQRFLQRGIASGGVVDLDGHTRGFLFEEFNVLCVKPELQPREVHQMEFSAFATRSGVELRQGLQLVRASSGDLELQLMNTHLEAFSEPIRDEQARELLAYLTEHEDRDAALVVFGDLNADPESSVYAALTGTGLIDTYAAAGEGPGATCCQTPELDGDSDVATSRIDYVLARNRAGAPTPRVVASEVVLDQRVARTGSDGLVWPSDHFGVLSTVEFPHRKEAKRKILTGIEQ